MNKEQIKNCINNLQFTLEEDYDNYNDWKEFESNSVQIYGDGSYRIRTIDNKVTNIDFYPSDYGSFVLWGLHLPRRISIDSYEDAINFCNNHYKEKVFNNHFNNGESN